MNSNVFVVYKKLKRGEEGDFVINSMGCTARVICCDDGRYGLFDSTGSICGLTNSIITAICYLIRTDR